MQELVSSFNPMALFDNRGGWVGLGLVVRGTTNPVFGLAICGRTISPIGLTIPPNGGIVNTTGDMVLTIPPYFVSSN